MLDTMSPPLLPCWHPETSRCPTAGKEPPSRPFDSPSLCDAFGNNDRAISLKRRELVDQSLLPPNPTDNDEDSITKINEVTPREVVDLEEITQLRSTTTTDNVDDLHLDGLRNAPDKILKTEFQLTFTELLDEIRAVHVQIAGIQHDLWDVNAGDLFICGNDNNAGGYLTETGKRGVVAAVVDTEINVDETLGCKALVTVENIFAVLPVLTASFYLNPSRGLSVIGVCVYGVEDGDVGEPWVLHSRGNKVEGADTSPDAVVRRLMAKMVRNGTKGVVMEVEGEGNQCDKIDFNIACKPQSSAA